MTPLTAMKSRQRPSWRASPAQALSSSDSATFMESGRSGRGRCWGHVWVVVRAVGLPGSVRPWALSSAE